MQQYYLIIVLFFSNFIMNGNNEIIQGRFLKCIREKYIDIEKICGNHFCICGTSLSQISCNNLKITLKEFSRIEDDFSFISNLNNTDVYYSYKEQIFTTVCQDIKKIEINSKISLCYNDLSITFYDVNDHKNEGFLNPNGIIINYSEVKECEGLKKLFFSFDKKIKILKINNIAKQQLKIDRKLKAIFLKIIIFVFISALLVLLIAILISSLYKKKKSRKIKLTEFKSICES
jgi:hypothetical protein